MSDITEYRMRALAAVNELRLSGYKVKHIKHADVVKVYLQNGKAWFVQDLPDITKYGKTIIKTHQTNDKQYIPTLSIVLEYNDNIICTFNLSQHITKVHGEVYENFKLSRDHFIGHINGNNYVNYRNGWLKKGTNPFSNNKVGDVLDSNFKTAISKTIDIKNDKFMMVRPCLILEHNPIKSFTFFTGYNDCIADGIYTKTDDELFKCKNEKGEIFALLFDSETKESYLVNATKIIKLTNVDECRADYEDDLYNGYELTSDEFWAIEELSYGKTQIIYQYKDIFFAGNGTIGELAELSARKPGSGARTKAALCYD